VGVKIKKRRGAWWVFIHYRRQRKAKRVGSKKAAELVALKIQARLAEGDTSPLKRVDDGPGPITFKAYATAWLANHAEQACKFSTVRIYKANLHRHVFPVVRAKRLASLNRADCRSLIAACRDTELGPKTVANIGRTLSSVLSQAVEDGLLLANPAFRARALLPSSGPAQAGDLPPHARGGGHVPEGGAPARAARVPSVPSGRSERECAWVSSSGPSGGTSDRDRRWEPDRRRSQGDDVADLATRGTTRRDRGSQPSPSLWILVGAR
jgi:hypothetical protein